MLTRSLILMSVAGALVMAGAFWLWRLYPAPAPTAHWVWSGITVQDVPATGTLYLYQGHATQKNGALSFTKHGLYPHALRRDLFLVYRLTKPLPAPQDLAAIFNHHQTKWTRSGAKVLGIQLDFDAATKGLASYAQYLRDLRRYVNTPDKISITGLGDWITRAPHAAQNELMNACDEIVFQLYQERAPLPGIEMFLKKLAHFNRPFKIGLLANANPERYTDMLAQLSHCQGIVLFHQKHGSLS
ncbi:MAG: DUF3142 domain-containing protein [Alphaproteobacteria bacterium]|nr:DUF3142 domain-containing protein [Alphaproteobacteria bacterium]